jgi:Peptidase M66
MRKLSIVTLAALIACSAEEDPKRCYAEDPALCGPAGTPAAPTPAEEQVAAQNRLAVGLAVRDVALFQAVKVPVVTKGVRVATAKSPLIAGRPGVLRVYVEPDADYTEQEVTVVLSLKQGEKVVATKKIARAVTRASDDKIASSVFDFKLEESEITTELSYSVTLTVTEATPGAAPETSPARYPQDGTYEALGATDATGTLKIVLVPVRYKADSSGRLPETSQAQLDTYRDVVRSLYPVANVEVSLRSAPLEWSSAIAGNGGGWDSILNAIVNLRERDKVASDVYYYGAFMPRTTFGNFCQQGCVTGLSGLGTDPRDEFVRASVGVGFPGEESANTMAHEIGHAHGRPHAPCGGAAGVDPSYPRSAGYANGAIGVWGYDIINSAFVAPTSKDFMSYCQPTWISDYSYTKLFDRILAVNASAASSFAGGSSGSQSLTENALPSALATSEPYRTAMVAADGSLTWGEPIHLRSAPRGESRTVRFQEMGANGIAALPSQASFYPYDHLPGGMLFVREPVKPWAHMEFNGRMLAR